MISDITLGQFFPGHSFIHRLDPRTKILAALIYIVAIFVANTPVAFAVLTLTTLLFVFISKISLKVIVKGIKPIIFILIFTAIINVLLTGGNGEPLLSFWIIEIYKEGIIKAAFMALRVILLIIGTSTLLTYTTSPISLTDGIESLLSPLKKVKVPVHIFAMMMTIALRFIPTLVEETEKIMNAQKSRGADFSSGGLIKRAKALVPILIPLFVAECRCYRGDKNRTKMKKLQFTGKDFVALFFVALILAVVIFSRFIPDIINVEHIVLSVLFYNVGGNA